MDHLGFGSAASEFTLALKKSETFIRPELITTPFFEDAAHKVAETLRGGVKEDHASQQATVGRLAALLSLHRGNHEKRELIRFEFSKAYSDAEFPQVKSAICEVLLNLAAAADGVYVTVARMYRASDSTTVAVMAVCTPLFSIATEDDAAEVSKLVGKLITCFEKGDMRLKQVIDELAISAVIPTTPSVFLALEIFSSKAVTNRLRTTEEYGKQVLQTLSSKPC